MVVWRSETVSTFAFSVMLSVTLFTAAQSDCGIPPPIDNAKLKDEYVGEETFPSGSEVSYVCDDNKNYGKKTGMKDTIVCEGSAWSEIPVFCERHCGVPPTFQFAVLDHDYFGIKSFSIDSNVTYHCLPGYTKIPRRSNRITCSQSSEWSHLPEFCQRKTCGSPGELFNGRVDLEDALFGSTAVFSCDEGFKLVGRAERICHHTGAWSGVVPACEPVICIDPPEIHGGTYSGKNKEEFTYQSSVTYRCTEPSLSLIGEASIFCTKDGTWSEDPPACKDISCPNPGIKNGHITSGFQTQYKYGDTITFRCDDTFIINGSALAECGTDNKWLPKHPECLPRESCPEPEVNNGHVIGKPESFKSGLETGYGINSKVTIECYPGHFITGGNNEIMCRSNLKWTLPVPTCVKRERCSVRKFMNGDIRGDSPGYFRSEYGYRVGSFIEFSCKPGYILIGEKNSSCQMDKRWSTEVPICKARESCPEPEVNNGHVIGKPESFKSGLETGYGINSKVTIECYLGHSITSGNNEIMCGPNLKWTSPVPTCVRRKSCGSPGVPLNGRVGLKDALSGPIATYSCDEGYRLVGSAKRTCLRNGAWSYAVPTCQRLSPTPSEKETQEGTPEGTQEGTPEGTQEGTDNCRNIPGGITAFCEVVDKKANGFCVEAEIERYKPIMEMKKLCLEIQKLQLEIGKLQS